MKSCADKTSLAYLFGERLKRFDDSRDTELVVVLRAVQRTNN